MSEKVRGPPPGCDNFVMLPPWGSRLMSSAAIGLRHVTEAIKKRKRLSFAELDAATSTSKTRLLSFFHTRITGQKPTFAKCFMQCFVHADQSTSQAHSDSSTLASHATTRDTNQHIDLICFFDRRQRSNDGSLMLIVDKVFSDGFLVDGDRSVAGRTRTRATLLFLRPVPRASPEILSFLTATIGSNHAWG